MFCNVISIVNGFIVLTIRTIVLLAFSLFLSKDEPVLAQALEGTRYDCGSKLGYLNATLAYGMKHPEVGADFSKHFELMRA